MKKERNDLGDSISAMARFCENEQDFLELVDALVEQVNWGVSAIGVTGSRRNGSNKPNSDLDIVLLRPEPITDWRSEIDRAGSKRRTTKGLVENWIHFTNVHPNNFFLFFNHQTQKIIKETDWQWTNDQQSLEKIMRISNRHPLIGLLNIAASKGKVWQRKAS